MISLNEFIKNAPKIDEESFRQAYEEVAETDKESYPVLVIAAAIHEFSNMINEHMKEFYLHELEKETK